MNRKQPIIYTSIVIPVYNKTDHIEPLINRIDKTSKKNNINYEIVIVDDGSDLPAWDKLLLIKANYKFIDIKIVSLKTNLSQNIATFYGVEYSKYDLIITMDADLQHLPEDIPKLINHLLFNKLKVVYAHPTDKNLHPITSKCFKNFTSIIDRKNYKFTSSFRAFDKRIINEKLTEPKKLWYWAIDTLLYSTTSEINFIEVHKPKKTGSTYNLARRLNISLKHIINDKRFYIFGFFSSVLLFFTSIFYFGSANSTTALMIWPAATLSIAVFIFLLYLFKKTRSVATINNNKIRKVIH